MFKSPELILGLLIICLISSCFPMRALFLAVPDEKDALRDNANQFLAPTTPFQFKKSTKDWGQEIKVNDWTKRIPFFRSIKELIADYPNNAFLIIKNDTILFETYDQSATTPNTSFSVAKSFISALIGIAIQEKLIGSEKDLVSKYIPEIASTQYANELTIEHLLNQTSGIKFDWKMDANIYYGKDILKSLGKIEFAHRPGTTQHYLNITTQLLGIILTRVSNKTVSAYLQEKIWQPLGMESNGFWNTDKKNKLERSFCCMNGSARDFAKFGRLYLNNGNWNGHQIVPIEWVEKSIARNANAGSSHGYNYSWHIGLKEYEDFMAEGLYAQYIYVSKKKNIIIVSQNDRQKPIKEHRLKWKYIFRQIVDQL